MLEAFSGDAKLHAALICIFEEPTTNPLQFRNSQGDAPDASSSTNTQPITALIRQTTLRRLTDFIDFVIALLARYQPLRINSCGTWLSLLVAIWSKTVVALVQEIPDED